MTTEQFDWNAAINEAEESGGDFEVLPAGKYHVQVIGAEATIAKSGEKSPMVSLVLRVLDEQYINRQLFSNLVRSGNPDARKMFVIKLMAFGFTKEWLAATEPSNEIIAKEILGREAIARVEVGEYKGEARNEVKGFRKPAARVPTAAAGVPTPNAVPAPPTIPSAPSVPTPSVPAPPVPPAPPAAPETTAAAEPVAEPAAPAPAASVPSPFAD